MGDAVVNILTIESKKTTKSGKTRSFSAALLGYLTADWLWPGGQSSTSAIRPVYAVVGGTESSLRPFLANIRKGRKAALTSSHTRGWSRSSNWVEFLKTAGYAYVWQRGAQFHSVTIFLPQLFQVDPGMIDKEDCQFLSAPPMWWVKQQRAVLDADRPARVQILAHANRLHLGDSGNGLGCPKLTDDELLELVPMAAHFVMMLDRRTRRPLINNLGFAVQLYLAALAQELATYDYAMKYTDRFSWGCHVAARYEDIFKSVDFGRLGFAPPVVFRAPQLRVDQFLTEQVRLYRTAGGK